MAEHTPTPWTWYWRESVEDDCSIFADCGITSETRPGHVYTVVRCPRYQTKEQWATDAAFIVRAVNAHDDLVATLKECVSEFYVIKKGETVSKRALAALAKAGAL